MKMICLEEWTKIPRERWERLDSLYRKCLANKGFSYCLFSISFPVIPI